MQNRKAHNKRMAKLERTARKRTDGTLCPGPSVPGHSIQHDEVRHAWIIDQMLVVCTRPEYFCLRLLLEHVDRCVPFARFMEHLQEVPISGKGMQKQERMRIAHTMSSLRAKVWALGLDIVSVMNVGYMLLSETPEEPSPSPQ